MTSWKSICCAETAVVACLAASAAARAADPPPPMLDLADCAGPGRRGRAGRRGVAQGHRRLLGGRRRLCGSDAPPARAGQGARPRASGRVPQGGALRRGHEYSIRSRGRKPSATSWPRRLCSATRRPWRRRCTGARRPSGRWRSPFPTSRPELLRGRRLQRAARLRSRLRGVAEGPGRSRPNNPTLVNEAAEALIFSHKPDQALALLDRALASGEPFDARRHALLLRTAASRWVGCAAMGTPQATAVLPGVVAVRAGQRRGLERDPLLPGAPEGRPTLAHGHVHERQVQERARAEGPRPAERAHAVFTPRPVAPK